MAQAPPLQGFHHITCVARNPGRTARFYARTLGLHFVKRTVNLDQPDTYHLYFGDASGTPGTIVTFFEWPQAEPGRVGIGAIHHFALTVAGYDALLKWKGWLQHARCLVAGPFDHGTYRSIILTDPDGIVVELATAERAWDEVQAGTPFVPAHDRLATDTWPDPITEIGEDMALGPIHHVAGISSDIDRTDAFYQGVLGLPLLTQARNPETEGSVRWLWGTSSRPSSVLMYTTPGDIEPPIHGRTGHGLAHHLALTVADSDLEAWHAHLEGHGVEVSSQQDRQYFHSIYFRDPDGLQLELATAEPGFLIDEAPDVLGGRLTLPEWLENRRAELEASLPPINL